MLARHTQLPVSYAVDGERFRAGHIYVAPPNQHLTLGKTTTILTRGPRENAHRPSVDVMFRSAAETFGNRVVAVVLSGYLSDGAVGQWEIHRHGGVAIAQDSSDAEVPDMPENAQRYSPTDYVLAAAEIPGVLVRLARGEQPGKKTTRKKSMVKTVTAQMKESEQFGKKAAQSSVYTCPECGGVLWELQHGGMVHYQCHVGHAYGIDDLLSCHSEKVEQALWTAFRVLEDNASLSRKVSTYMKKRAQRNVGAGVSGTRTRVIRKRGIIEIRIAPAESG